MVEIYRRTFPTEVKNGGPAEKSPARPPVVITTFAKLKSEYAKKAIGAITLTQPLCPHKVISVGGCRSIGGGTSTEALRRARKHLARLNHSR